MSPWDRIQPETDTSIRFIHECVRCGHTVATCTVNNLAIRHNIASAVSDLLQGNIR